MNAYRCVFQMGVEKALEYRTSFFLTLLSAIFPIIIQIFLWNYLYANPDMEAIFGYSHSQMLVYTLLATIVSKLVSTGCEYEINQDIKDGGLNKYLVRPVNYQKYRFFAFLGQKLPQFLLMLAAASGLVLFSVWKLELSLSVGRVLIFLFCLFLAVILNFLIFYCLALVSFWLDNVSLLFGTVSIVLVVVSGGVFPMDIFGEGIAFLVNLLPFSYTTQFPVNIINGRFGMQRIGIGLLCQLGWMIFFFGLSEILWKRGLKRFIGVGG